MYILTERIMQKPLFVLVIALLCVSVVGLILFSTAFFGTSTTNGRGHMMQDSSGVLDSSNIGWLLLFVVPLVVALGVIVYMLTFPKIKQTPAAVEAPQTVMQSPHNKQTLDAVLKVLNEDERKVVETLASTKEGSMLQKEIRWKTNLSRVKIHRVVARLAERGIVIVEKQDNTNKVTLAGWITKPSTA
jgi:uncharacterized membrane protein